MRSSRARRATLLAGCLIAAIAATAPAGAQEDGTLTRVTLNDRDDVSGPLDLSRVALAVTADRELRAEITMYGDWDGTDLAARNGAPASTCMKIWTKRDARDDPPDYLVCVTPARDEPAELVGRVLRERANGLPRTVAPGVVTRPNQRSVHIRFPQTAIGRPALLRFAGESVHRGSRCAPPLGCVDLAPSVNASGRLRLR